MLKEEYKLNLINKFALKKEYITNILTQDASKPISTTWLPEILNNPKLVTYYSKIKTIRIYHIPFFTCYYVIHGNGEHYDITNISFYESKPGFIKLPDEAQKYTYTKEEVFNFSYSTYGFDQYNIEYSESLINNNGGFEHPQAPWVLIQESYLKTLNLLPDKNCPNTTYSLLK